MIPKADRPFFAKGIMLGLVAMPVGLAAGGLLSGLSVVQCLHQNLPIFALAVLLLLGLWKIPNKMIKGFILLSEGIRWLVTISLALAAVESMTGFNPIPGMTPIADAMATVSSIAVVLLGSLPIAELVRRLLMRPFAWLGERLHMKPQSLTGMLISLVSSLPTLSMYEEMDNPGQGGSRRLCGQRHQPAGGPHGLYGQRGAHHAGPGAGGEAHRRPGRGRAGAVPEKRTGRNRKSSVRYHRKSLALEKARDFLHLVEEGGIWQKRGRNERMTCRGNSIPSL